MTAEADRGKTEARKYNEAKLASLYDECYDKIARYIFVRMGSRAEAEDLAGEVFLKALEPPVQMTLLITTLAQLRYTYSVTRFSLAVTIA